MASTAHPSSPLLEWYDRHRRRLPWRALPGERMDPYRVWLSEIMLQQTTVQAVVPYYESFLKRWPNVGDLARADLDDVLHAWAGLGYYARARNLHKCAQFVVARHGGRFPDNEAALLELPGVGSYTAAAIAAIAFDIPAAVVDGNVERVIARLFAIDTPPIRAKGEIRALAGDLTPADRPGDHAQAMMDLGATICTPRNPACGLCPFRDRCLARIEGDPEAYPAKEEKKPKPTRRGTVFWLVRGDGAVLLRRRPESGLLGGMMEFPGSVWTEGPLDPEAALDAAPIATNWRRLDGQVSHTFTHFHLELVVFAASIRLGDAKLGTWCPVDRLGDQALPTLFAKVARHVLKHA